MNIPELTQKMHLDAAICAELTEKAVDAKQRAVAAGKVAESSRAELYAALPKSPASGILVGCLLHRRGEGWGDSPFPIDVITVIESTTC